MWVKTSGICHWEERGQSKATLETHADPDPCFILTDNPGSSIHYYHELKGKASWLKNTQYILCLREGTSSVISAPFQRHGWNISEGCVAFVIKKLYIIKGGSERPYSTGSHPSYAMPKQACLSYLIHFPLADTNDPKMFSSQVNALFTAREYFFWHWIWEWWVGGRKEVI